MVISLDLLLHGVVYAACILMIQMQSKAFLTMHSTLDSAIDERLAYHQLRAWWSDQKAMCQHDCGCDWEEGLTVYDHAITLTSCAEDALSVWQLSLQSYRGNQDFASGLYLRRDNEPSRLWLPFISEFDTLQYDDNGAMLLVHLFNRRDRMHWLWRLA